MGWATGTGDTNADVMINPSGLAPAGLVQVSPEFGYWLDSSLMLSLQIRYQYITGTTDIYAPQTEARVYHTANYALAAFAKATWKFGREASSTRSSRCRPAPAASATSSASSDRC